MGKDDSKLKKDDQRVAAAAAMAVFFSKGGTIKRGPDVVPTLFTCDVCGGQSMVGIAENQRRSIRCPKCGAARARGRAITRDSLTPSLSRA
jgi:hypothetical protein